MPRSRIDIDDIHPEDADVRDRLTRRGLLARAGVLAATAELGASSLAGCGSAGQSTPAPLGGDTDDTEAGFTPPSLRPAGAAIYSFFTADEAKAVDAMAARLIPGSADDPGAREAGVVTYIDLKLAQFPTFAVQTYFHGPFESLVNHPVGPQDHAPDEIEVEKDQLPRYGFQSSLTPQESYRAGLEALDAYTRRKQRKPFAEWSPSAQDLLLAKMENGKINEFIAPTSQGFFAMVLEDTYECMSADPKYGGNRDMAGWKLIGYPGAQRA